MQTHLVPKIVHQNLAVILWQFNYSENSFIVLVPDIIGKILHRIFFANNCRKDGKRLEMGPLNKHPNILVKGHFI